MLIWMCALKCEAKPLIDHYRLRKPGDSTPYALYRGANMACVVSGLGAANMAEATIWAAGNLCNDTGACVWINLGIAGHENLDIGTLVLAESFHDAGEPSGLAASLPITTALPRIPLLSVPAPQAHYPPDVMIDMEGWSFATRAGRRGETEWCPSLKVISDNAANPPTRDKAAISALIAAQIDAIDEFASALMDQANLGHE